MTPLYTENEFKNSRYIDSLKLQCSYCRKEFLETKKQILKALNGHKSIKCLYCSVECRNNGKNKQQIVNCSQCNKSFSKRLNQIKKSLNHFCCCSCNITYNNQHKTKGTRVSKLELFIQNMLTGRYNFDFHFNRSDTINSELDIYIPSLKLAFELNGIFHYEPIFGEDKLQKTVNNDNRKFQACLERGIELCIIDTSGQKRFTEQSSIKFLNIIFNIIDSKG